MVAVEHPRDRGRVGPALPLGLLARRTAGVACSPNIGFPLNAMTRRLFVGIL
jgi:hypothetical protein